MRAQQVVVGTTPTLVVDGGGGTGYTPEAVVIHPASTKVFYGGPDVNTTTKGYPVDTTDGALVLPAVNGKLYGIVAAATTTVTLLRTVG